MSVCQLCEDGSSGKFWLRVSCEVTAKKSARAGVICRFVSGLQICCKEGSLTRLTSWCWLLAGDLRVPPPGLLSWLLEHGQNMAALWPENESWRELKIEAMVSFAPYAQKSHSVTFMISHLLKRVTNRSPHSAEGKSEAAPSERKNIFVDIF